MKPKFNPFFRSFTLAASIVLCCGQNASADSFTWDSNGVTSGVTDGAGTWSDTTGSLWWNGSTNSIWSNTGPHDAIFGNFNGAAGTIAIGTAITVGDLTFNPAGSGRYTLSGATNGATNTITLSGAAPTITTNQSATISARIVSTNGFVKEGLGSLTVTGSPADGTANTIGGTITVNAGQLVFDGSTNTFGGDGAFQGNLTLANFGRFTHSGANTIGNNAQITVGAGAFAQFNNSDSIGAFAGAGRVSIAATTTLTSGTQNFSGVLSGAGAITMGGTTTSQTLSGANLYTGTITANASGTTLALNNVNALQYGTLSKGSSAVTFTVAGTNTYNIGGLSGASALNIGANTISVGGNNANTTFSSSIGFGTTAGGLTKVGTGTLTLSGTSVYSGATTISRGTLELQGAGALGTSGITFNGTSGFTYTGSAAGSSDSVGALTRSAGNGTITSTYGTSGNVALTFTSLATRTSGATADFRVTGGTNGTTNKIVLSGATANAFIDQGTFFGGSNFAWYDNLGFVRALAYGSDTGAVTTAGGSSLASTAHQETTGAVTAQNSATFNTLKISGANAFTLAASQTLTVNGILKTGTTAEISGGSGIQAASGQDLVVRTDISTDALSINTPILANGANGFVKTGAGSLTLGSLAVNTYTGGTFVNQGTLIVNQDNNLGSTAAANNIRLNGGTLQASSNITLHANHGIDIGAGGGTINGGSQFTLNNANMLSGSGPLTITGSGSTNSVLNSGATQDFTGPMTISSGRIVLNAANITNPYGTGDITVGAGSSSVYVNASGSVWDNRFFISGNGGEGRGVIRAQNGGTFNGDIILTGNASVSSETGSTTTTLNGNVSGAFTLTLGGQTSASTSAKYVLTGNNIHSATTVGTGITNIDHDIALGAYNGTVTINGNGTLQAGAADIILNPDRTVAMSAASGAHNIDTGAFDMTIQGIITGASTEILNKQGAGKLTLTGTNTHTGVMGISAGTLNVASLSDYGVASSIGARTALSETASGDGIGLRIGTGATGATLQYTGSTAQSTNRQIRISAANNSIDASGTGSGTLSFTYSGANTNLFDTVGARTLTLTGTNTGNNTFAIGLTDQNVTTGKTTLTKTDLGKWVLTGESSHTGGTNINNGILALSGSGTTGATTGAIAMGGGQFDLGGLTRTVGAVSITSAYASGDTITNGDLIGASFATSNASGTATISANLQGAAATFTKTGAGNVSLTGANTFGGGTNINGGILSLSGSGTTGATTGAISLGGGQFDIGGLTRTVGAVSITSAYASGDTITNGDLIGASFASSNASGTATISANLQGAAATFTKTGAGTVKLTGANTYGGTTTLTTGTIQIGAGNVGSVGAITSSAIGTGTLTFNGGTFSSDSATPRTILNAVTYAVASTFGNVTNNGKLTFSADGNLGTIQKTMTVNSDVQFDGILSGTGGGISLGTSAGYGKLTLANTLNSFTGNVTLNANSGTLRITSSGALGIGPKTVTNTAASSSVPVTGANLLELDSNGGADISLASNISFSLSGAAGVILNTAGDNTIAGNIGMTTGNGTVKILSDGGTLTLSGTVTANTNRDFELAGTSVGNIFSGVLQNNGGNIASLVKSGAGTWSVSGGSNTFTGNTKVNGGTLKLANNLAIQNSVFDTSGAGALDTEGVTTPTFGGLTAGGNLALHSNVTSLTLNLAGTQTYSGSFSGGTGLALVKSGTGTQILSNSNSYAGLTTVSNGVLNIQNPTALGTTAGGTVVNGTNTGTATNARLELQGDITVTGEALTINGVGNFTGALNSKSGSNEWAGNVTIGSSGTRIGAQNGATLKVSGVIDSGVVSTGLVVRNEGSTGTVILSGANTYLGDTTFLFGKLQLDGGNNRLPVATKMLIGNAANVTEFDLNGRNQEIAGLSLNGGVTASAVSVNNSSATSSTLTINTAAASPSTYAGIVKGNLGLTKAGADTFTLSAANTYTGDTTINEGTLALGASGSIDSTSGVALGGGTFDVSAKGLGGYTVNNLTGTGSVVGGLTVSTTLAIGNSPGEVSFDGDLTLGTTSIAANFDYEFTGGATAADLGIVSGDLTLDSKAFLNLFQLGTYTLGDTFTLFAYNGSVSGTFIGLAEGDTTTDNLGGMWRINYGETTAGDNYFGAPVSGGFVNITAVPEPNVAALLGALGTLILLRRRRA